MALMRAINCGDVRGHHGDGAQMSVELMVVLPVAIGLALVLVNGLSFMASCASLDRIARNAVRVYATSPAYGKDQAAIIAEIEDTVRAEAPASIATCEVGVDAGFLGQVTYRITVDFSPTLFGLGLRSTATKISRMDSASDISGSKINTPCRFPIKKSRLPILSLVANTSNISPIFFSKILI